MKKLLLVYPNQRWLKNDIVTTWNLNPYTLCLLAAMVKNDVTVKIVDAQFYDMSVADFRKSVEEYAPDYVGISVLTSEYAGILDIAAEAVKQVNPHAVVIAGGVHVTMEYQTVMQNHDVDYAIRGEGEYVLADLVRYLNGTASFPNEGIVYRENNQIIALSQAFVEDISKLPWPDYSLINLSDYLNTGPRLGPLRPPEFPYMRMIVTRGCPFGCSFCQVEVLSGRQVRARDAVDVVNEIIYYKETYGIKSVVFDDDNIIMAREFFIQMLQLLISKQVGVKFIFQSFALFLLDKDTLDLMAKAGCVGLNVSIESGNKRVLKEIVQKPSGALDKAIEVIRQIREKGLFCSASFVIGFPSETWEEIRETIRFAEICGADYIKIFVAVPLRGTKLWNYAVQHNAFIDPDNIKVDWRFSQIKSDEWTSQDVSILRAYEWDRINFATQEKRKRVAELWGINEEELFHIRKETRDSLIFK